MVHGVSVAVVLMGHLGGLECSGRWLGGGGKGANWGANWAHAMYSGPWPKSGAPDHALLASMYMIRAVHAAQMQISGHTAAPRWARAHKCPAAQRHLHTPGHHCPSITTGVH